MARVRKQVDELTSEDFEVFPAWEFALDEEGNGGQNEATVRPVKGRRSAKLFKTGRIYDPADTDGDLIVRASFCLSDGAQEWGYLSAPAVEGYSCQPVITTGRGQVIFYYGAVVPTADRIEESYRRLNKTREQVFPVRYESVVELKTGPITGILEGFNYFEYTINRADRKIIVVK